MYVSESLYRVVIIILLFSAYTPAKKGKNKLFYLYRGAGLGFMLTLFQLETRF